MKRVGWAALALACLLTACVRTSDGVPVAGEAGPNAVTSLSPRSATAAPTQPGDQPAYGVVPTARAPVPPNTVACSQSIKPSVRMTAEVDDPQAPRITIGVPDKWSMTASTGDVGGKLNGPGDMEAIVTIAVTQLEPAAAFRKYTDD